MKIYREITMNKEPYQGLIDYNNSYSCSFKVATEVLAGNTNSVPKIFFR